MPCKNPKQKQAKAGRPKSSKRHLLTDRTETSSLRNKGPASALAAAGRPLLPHKIVTIQSDLDEPKALSSKLSKAPTSKISRHRVLRSRRRAAAAHAQDETLQEHVQAKLSKRLSRSKSGQRIVAIGAVLASKTKKSKKRSR